jgi:hypothetical protein
MQSATRKQPRRLFSFSFVNVSSGESFSLLSFTSVVLECTMVMGRFSLCAEHFGIVASLVEYTNNSDFAQTDVIQTVYFFSIPLALRKAGRIMRCFRCALFRFWSCCVCSTCEWHSLRGGENIFAFFFQTVAS